MNSSFLGDLVSLSIKEARRRILMLATMFAVVAVVALAVVITAPKTWESSALIVAETSNIIKPILDGRAVPTTITDQTAVVSQVMQSKRILREILAFSGSLPARIDPRDEERLITKLRSRIRIENTRPELIRVSYKDSDPKRTYQVTNKIAEIYVREGAEGKARESREAFEFIAKQVTEYGQKLSEAHEKLLAYYKGQDAPQAAAPAGTAGAGGEQPETPPPPRPRLKISAEDLAALRAEEATLASQLGRRATPAEARNEQRQTEEHYRTRVMQLQTDLDRLLATYTEEHPDVKRAHRDLANAREELRKVEAARVDQESARAAASALDDQVTAAARARLEDVRRQISAATGVPRRSSRSRGTSTVAAGLTAAAAEAATIPEMRNVGQDTQLSELLRRYEATRDVYQDLLKRRENARVSMELDIERQGLTLRIQEPAEMPMTASGLRLFQQTAIGLVLALLVPIGFLLALVRLDPRVRSPSQVEKMARLPLLVTIPYAPTPSETVRHRNHRAMAIALVGSALAIYLVVFIVRLTTAK